MYDLDICKRCLAFKERTGRWPRSRIIINGVIYTKKRIMEIESEEDRQELLEEFDLYYNWKNCELFKYLSKNKNSKLGDYPEYLRDVVKELRKARVRCVGVSDALLDEYVKFYKKHGRLPKKNNPTKLGLNLKEEKALRKERLLYLSFNASSVCKMLRAYRNVSIDSVPEEYREMVKKGRAIGLYSDYGKKSSWEVYVDFFREHKREAQLINEPKTLEEAEEREIRSRWLACCESRMYKKYQGYALDEIPDNHKETVKRIRDAIEEIDGTNVAEEIIEYIKQNCRLPRELIEGFNTTNLKEKDNLIDELTLNDRWRRCFERNLLKRYRGIPIERIPDRYKNTVAKFREIGLGRVESFNTYQYINFIYEHGRAPKYSMIQNNKYIPIDECDPEVKIERIIRCAWEKSKDLEIYRAYKKGVLDDKNAKLYAGMLKDLDNAYHFADLSKELNKAKCAANEVTKVVENKNEQRKKEREMAEKRKEQNMLDAAEEYITFVKEHKKTPRSSIRVQGRTALQEEMTEEERREVLIRENWNKCHFDSVIEKFVGCEIENVPEKYRALIQKFREEGYGLTYEEYAKYRESHNTKSILRAIQKTKGYERKRSNKAKSLEAEIEAQLRKIKKDKEQEK